MVDLGDEYLPTVRARRDGDSSLFASPVWWNHRDPTHGGTLSVDDWFKFTAPARVGVLVQRLRHYMDTLLEKKFEHPESLIADDPVLKGVCSLLISNGL